MTAKVQQEPLKKEKPVVRDGPSDEEDLAFAAIIDCDEIEIEDGVSAIVFRQRRRQIVVALAGPADLIDGYQSRSFVDLEHDVPMHLLPLHFHERALALLRHAHARRRLQIKHRIIKIETN